MLIRSWMQQLGALRRNHGIEVIWVTSGAIASAKERTHLGRSNPGLSEKQALSAVGQPLIMDLYNMALQANGLLGAQILLTYDDLANPARRRNFQNTMETLLNWKVTPIINENDAVATEEIRFGDNDSLSAKVARFSRSDRLIVLTDVDGLFDSDPKKNPRARLIRQLSAVTPALLREISPKAGSERGTGGMYSKLLAAREATRYSIETWLVRGDHPSILGDIAQRKATGTWIHARKRHEHP